MYKQGRGTDVAIVKMPKKKKKTPGIQVSILKIPKILVILKYILSLSILNMNLTERKAIFIKRRKDNR